MPRSWLVAARPCPSQRFGRKQSDAVYTTSHLEVCVFVCLFGCVDTISWCICQNIKYPQCFLPLPWSKISTLQSGNDNVCSGVSNQTSLYPNQIIHTSVPTSTKIIMKPTAAYYSLATLLPFAATAAPVVQDDSGHQHPRFRHPGFQWTGCVLLRG